MASNEVKLPRAHLNTVPNGLEELSYLHAEDPTVIAEECAKHPAAADNPNTDDVEFGLMVTMMRRKVQKEVISPRKRRRRNSHSLNNALLIF